MAVPEVVRLPEIDLEDFRAGILDSLACGDMITRRLAVQAVVSRVVMKPGDFKVVFKPLG